MIAKLFLKMIGNTSINFQQTNWHFLISYTRIIYLFFCVSKFVLSGSFALITKITLVCRAARPLSPLGSRKTNIRRRKEERLPKHRLSSQGKSLSFSLSPSELFSHGGGEPPSEIHGYAILFHTLQNLLINHIQYWSPTPLPTFPQLSPSPPRSQGQERPVGLSRLPRRRQGHLRLPPHRSPRRPPHRHRRSCPRGARVLRSPRFAGELGFPFLF